MTTYINYDLSSYAACTCCASGFPCCSGVIISGDLVLTVTESDQCCEASGAIRVLTYHNVNPPWWVTSGVCGPFNEPTSYALFCSGGVSGAPEVTMDYGCRSGTGYTIVGPEPGWSCDPPDFTFNLINAAISDLCCGVDGVFKVRITK